MQIDRIIIFAAMPVVGFVVGILYFQGLWLTIRRYSHDKYLGGRLLVSFLLRLALAMGVFYYCMQNNWQRLVLLLIGFLIGRQVMIRRVRPPSLAPKAEIGESET